jgi:N-acetylglutamate synthase-like GNAT family acetyltransferase
MISTIKKYLPFFVDEIDEQSNQVIKIKNFESKYLGDCLKISKRVGISFEITYRIKFVALCDDEVVGFLNANLFSNELFMEYVAILEDFRKLGFGKLFLNKCIDIASKNRVSIIKLYSIRSARDYWKKSGFKETILTSSSGILNKGHINKDSKGKTGGAIYCMELHLSNKGGKK